MSIWTLCIYLISSIILFFLLNYVNKKEDNMMHYGVITCIYLLLVSGICSSFHLTKNNDAVFIVFLFEMLIRIFYTNMIREVNLFRDRDMIIKYLFTFGMVFGLNTFFISRVKSVFLNLEQFKIILWLLIIIYLFSMYKSYQKSSEKKKIQDVNDRKIKKEYRRNEQYKEYVVMQYAKYKNMYSLFVRPIHSLLIPLIYAIMIYENKNRPELFRKLDYTWYQLNGKGRKFGIMQIYSKYYIDDENSISIAIRRLERIYSQVKNSKNIEKVILKEYYKKDNVVDSVMDILKEIKRFNQKN